MLKAEVTVDHSEANITEESLYSLLLRYKTIPNRSYLFIFVDAFFLLYDQGTAQFSIVPISSALISEIVRFFDLSAYKRVLSDGITRLSILLE